MKHQLFVFVLAIGISHCAFTQKIQPYGLTTRSSQVLTMADIDNDGDLDVFGIRRAFIGMGDVFFQECEPAGDSVNFKAHIKDPFGLKMHIVSPPSFVDIDDDGDLDAFVARAGFIDMIRVYYYKNVGTKAQLKLARRKRKPFGLKYRSLSAPTFVDIDNDGDYDVFGVRTGIQEGKVYYCENVGTAMNPKFAKRKKKPFNLKYKSYSSPTFFDFDQDGDLDLFGHGPGGLVYVQMNIGTREEPVFASWNKYPFQVEVYSSTAPQFGDIDRDGLYEVLVTVKIASKSGLVMIIESDIKVPE